MHTDTMLLARLSTSARPSSWGDTGDIRTSFAGAHRGPVNASDLLSFHSGAPDFGEVPFTHTTMNMNTLLMMCLGDGCREFMTKNGAAAHDFWKRYDNESEMGAAWISGSSM